MPTVKAAAPQSVAHDLATPLPDADIVVFPLRFIPPLPPIWRWNRRYDAINRSPHLRRFQPITPLVFANARTTVEF
jgi:hypothetical protein